ncbi:MAG: hypothetical protein EXS58_17440 [Candidatus Latescibacteria bacterium]|nr:hypothetical protein [Candidatus Latescibacterota bacterium]
MYTLSNQELEVSILDPVVDQERFGTRYCTGGYIFQVADHRLGNLMTGPTYPDAFNWFDGQGIPDAFSTQTQRDGATGNQTLVPGIGVCDLQERKVLEWCQWEVKAEPTLLRFRTRQQLGDFSFELERTVQLLERSVRSETRLKQGPKGGITLRWYPHPFYPHPQTDELIKFNIPVSFPENPGYEMGANGFIRRRNWPWSEGYFQALDHRADRPLIAVQRHPILGLVSATCSYIPASFPIWGNARTFSWEPFLERTLHTNQEMDWWISYDF